MGINFQDVLDNRTSKEWQEVFRQSIEEDFAIIAEVMDKNDRLRNHNKALAVVVGGLALCVVGIFANRQRKNYKGVVTYEK